MYQTLRLWAVAPCIKASAAKVFCVGGGLKAKNYGEILSYVVPVDICSSSMIVSSRRR